MLVIIKFLFGKSMLHTTFLSC